MASEQSNEVGTSAYEIWRSSIVPFDVVGPMLGATVEVPAKVAEQIRAIALLKQMDEADLMREVWDQYVERHPGLRSK